MRGARRKKAPQEGGKPKRRRRRWRRWVALLLLILIGAIGGGSSGLWFLSRSYRIRGLERWIEARIRESTSLDVRIGEIVSHPLSELVATEIRSLEVSDGAAPGAISFTCARASLLYDPLRLLAGEVREIRIDGLRARIDLDHLDTLPLQGGAGSGIRVLSLAVEAPEATIVAGGRAYDIGDLRIRFGSLRGDPAQPVEISARYAGAELEIWGTLEDGPDGIRIGQAHFQVAQADLSRLLDKIPLALPARGSGRARIDGSARGVWPKRITWQIETRLDGVDLSSEAIRAGVRSGSIDLALTGAIEGHLDAVDLACKAEGRMRWGPTLRELPEAWTLEWNGRYESAAASGGGEAKWRLDRSRFESRDLGTIEIAGEVRDPFGRPRLDLTLDARAAALSLLARRLEALHLAGVGGTIGAILARVESGLAGLAGGASIRARLLGDASDPHGSFALSLDQAALRSGGIEFAGTRAELTLEGTAARLTWNAEGMLGDLAIAGSGRWKDVAFTGCGRILGETGEVIVEEVNLRPPSLPSIWLRGVGSAEGYREVEISGGPARFEGFRRLFLSLGVSAPAIPAGVDGLIEGAVTLRRGAWDSPEHSFHGEVRLADGAYVAGSGPDGVSGIRAALQLDGMVSAAQLCMRLTCEPRAREILAGRFFRDVSKDRFSVTATIEADLRPLRIRVPSATFDLPGAGAVRLEGSADEKETRIRCEIPDADGAAILAIAREGFWECPPAIQSLDIAGRVSCDVEYVRREGREAISGEIGIRAGSGPIAAAGNAGLTRPSARLAYGPARIEGLYARIPFDIGDAFPGARRSAGVVRFDALHIGPFVLPGTEFAIGWDGRDFRIAGEIRGDVAGGAVAVADMAVEQAFAAGRRFRASFQAEHIDLAAVLRALGATPIPGEIAAALPAVEMRGGELRADGEILARVFGGAARIRNPAVHDAGTPYALLEIEEARLDEIRLLDLGQTFRFGLISGIAKAAVRNLAIASDGVYGFEAEFETVPRPGVPQYVDKTAIESIGRILHGPLYTFERTFFSTFKYAGFGFACSLRNEVFKLEGKYRSGGREYILWSNWYQVPRIDIVNALPGLPYDWRTIYRNLRDAQSGKSQPKVE